MSERSIGAIQVELDQAIFDEREAGDRRRRLTKEIAAAKVAEATASPHPWLGKQVKRRVRRGYRGEYITRKGILTIFDPAVHRGLRELYFSGADGAGRLFVLSASGQTGWSFDTTEAEWELA